MATINSASANPEVWIVGGKAYSDASHGGYKTNYYNAVRKLGQNLGWNVKAGSKSAQNLAALNQRFNNAGIKTVLGKRAVITSKGLAGTLRSRTTSQPPKSPYSQDITSTEPLYNSNLNLATISTLNLDSYNKSMSGGYPYIWAELYTGADAAKEFAERNKFYKIGGKLKYFI